MFAVVHDFGRQKEENKLTNKGLTPQKILMKALLFLFFISESWPQPCWCDESSSCSPAPTTDPTKAFRPRQKNPNQSN